MKTGNNQSAPLFAVYGSLTSKNTPSVRLYPLKKAKNRNGAWFYPSEGGTQMVPDVMLGEVDDQTTPGGKQIFKIYFQEEKLIAQMVDMMNKRMCQMSGTPMVQNLSLPSAVRSSVMVAKQEPKVIIPDTAPTSPKLTAANSSFPEGARDFQGRNLEDYLAVQNILHGYKDEFAVIYKRYYDTILFRYNKSFSFKEPDLCADLVMEMFERVYERLAQYTPKFTFNAWITKIAENYLIDYCRKTRNHPFVSLDKGFHDSDGNESGTTMGDMLEDDGSNCPEKAMMLGQRKEALNKALAKLDEKTRRMIIQRFFYKASYADIMKDENIDMATVKTAIFRAKLKLKKVFVENPQLLAAVEM
jgi:RNA polymerase sigma factor (sigma-70 family)